MIFHFSLIDISSLPLCFSFVFHFFFFPIRLYFKARNALRPPWLKQRRSARKKLENAQTSNSFVYTSYNDNNTNNNNNNNNNNCTTSNPTTTVTITINAQDQNSTNVFNYSSKVDDSNSANPDKNSQYKINQSVDSLKQFHNDPNNNVPNSSLSPGSPSNLITESSTPEQIFQCVVSIGYQFYIHIYFFSFFCCYFFHSLRNSLLNIDIIYIELFYYGNTSLASK